MQVKNPFEPKEVVGITNYIDFGFELLTRYFQLLAVYLNMASRLVCSPCYTETNK